MWQCLVGFLAFFTLVSSALATSDDTLSVTPSAVSATTITAADENSRNSSISTTFNAHSHVNDTEMDRSARVRNTAAISLTSGTATILTFDSERWDTDTIHSTASNTGRLTATTAGKYQITGHVAWQANANEGNRILDILLNGATIIASESCLEKPANASDTVRCTITTHYNLAATDYVELRATQRAVATLNINATGNYYTPTTRFLAGRFGTTGLVDSTFGTAGFVSPTPSGDARRRPGRRAPPGSGIGPKGHPSE